MMSLVLRKLGGGYWDPVLRLEPVEAFPGLKLRTTLIVRL